MSEKLKINDNAPDFTAKDPEGNPIHFKELLGETPIVLYFYPKDFSQGCTKQAQAFRDNYEALKEQGAKVVGISPDSPESHKKFQEKHNLPFLLLSDEDHSISQLYGVKSTLGFIPGRETFIINSKGEIKHLYTSQFKPKKHIEEAIKVVKELNPENGKS